MITDEERQSIINEAVEKALLMLPEVIGNLIMNQTKTMTLIKNFYSKYPDIAEKKELVAAIVEKTEAENPGSNYEEILDKAAPVIRERIKAMKLLDTTKLEKPVRDLSNLKIAGSNLGEL